MLSIDFYKGFADNDNSNSNFLPPKSVSEVFYHDDGRKMSYTAKNPLRGSSQYARGATVKFHPKNQPHYKDDSLRLNPFNDYGDNPLDLGESQNLEQIAAPVDIKRKNSNFDLRINVNKKAMGNRINTLQRPSNQNIDEMVDDLS